MRETVVNASEVLKGPSLATPAGGGITTGTGTIYRSGVVRKGDLVETTIFIDLTGLDSDATEGDIIGLDATALACHLGQWTDALNGDFIGAKMECIEAPTTGEVDIDLYSADEATGVTDGAIADLTETAIIAAAADWTAGAVKTATGDIANAEYLYLTVGTASTPTAGTYDAGKFVITLYGEIAET